MGIVGFRVIVNTLYAFGQARKRPNGVVICAARKHQGRAHVTTLPGQPGRASVVGLVATQPANIGSCT